MNDVVIESPSWRIVMPMKSADEVIKEISECLAEADGEFIEQIANMVLSNSVKYVGDSMFETSYSPA